MKITVYKKRDGSGQISSTKIKMGDYSTTYDPSYNVTGHSQKIGRLTVFSGPNFNPMKFGIKIGGKTQYCNTKWKCYK